MKIWFPFSGKYMVWFGWEPKLTFGIRKGQKIA